MILYVWDCMKKSHKYPKRLVQGNSKVTLYRTKHAKTASGWIYQVTWYDESNARRLKQFTDPDEAISDGKRRLERIAAGEIEAAGVSSSDLRELMKARNLAGDVPLLSALAEWQAARKYANVHLIEAAKEWQERNGDLLREETLEFVYSRFIEAKQNAGNVIKTYTVHLDVLISKYGALKMSEIKEPMLQAWIDSFNNPSSKNTKRRKLVTFFRWAQKKAYVSDSRRTAAELTDTAVEIKSETETIEATTLFNLLEFMKKHHPQYVAPLALAGLCGLRRAEVQGQLWDDIHLKRRLLKVTVAKKNTPAYRIVRLSEKALHWLSFAAQTSGKVCKGKTSATDRIRELGVSKGLFKLPPNCFRNGYISHLVALAGNIERTSLEAGNSPAIIRKHYLELFTAEKGAEWFGSFPEMTGEKIHTQKTEGAA